MTDVENPVATESASSLPDSVLEKSTTVGSAGSLPEATPEPGSKVRLDSHSDANTRRTLSQSANETTTAVGSGGSFRVQIQPPSEPDIMTAVDTRYAASSASVSSMGEGHIRPEQAADYDSGLWSKLSSTRLIHASSAESSATKAEEAKAEDNGLTNEELREIVQSWVDSLSVQFLVSCLVITDLVIGVGNFIKKPRTEFATSLAFESLYCLEISIRMWAYTPSVYFSRWLDRLDITTVVLSVICTVVAYSLFIAQLLLFARIALILRVLRLVRLLRALTRASVTRSQKLQAAVRELNHSTLKGYHDSKFNLNISYITDNILLMGAPAEHRSEHFTRDPMSDVVEFLKERHNDHFQIYDLRDLQAVDAKRDSADLGHLLRLAVHDDRDPYLEQQYQEAIELEMHKKKKKHKSQTNLEIDRIDEKHRAVEAGTTTSSVHTCHMPSKGNDDILVRNVSNSRNGSMRPSKSATKNQKKDGSQRSIHYLTFASYFDRADQIWLTDFGFSHFSILPLRRLVECVHQMEDFLEISQQNVVILQSTTGLGRAMFICCALIVHFYPTGQLWKIRKFVKEHRVSDEKHYILPSQDRYLVYFKKLVEHCYEQSDDREGELQLHHEDSDGNLTPLIKRQSTLFGRITPKTPLSTRRTSSKATKQMAFAVSELKKEESEKKKNKSYNNVSNADDRGMDDDDDPDCEHREALGHHKDDSLSAHIHHIHCPELMGAHDTILYRMAFDTFLSRKVGVHIDAIRLAPVYKDIDPFVTYRFEVITIDPVTNLERAFILGDSRPQTDLNKGVKLINTEFSDVLTQDFCVRVSKVKEGGHLIKMYGQVWLHSHFVRHRKGTRYLEFNKAQIDLMSTDTKNEKTPGTVSLKIYCDILHAKTHKHRKKSKE